MRRAFSYSRFSTAEQKDGRSQERQLEAAKAYCARHGLKLDDRTYIDKGVSGFHGANATHGELAEFLRLVKEGRIPRGSVVIIENVDRLSRLPPDEATALIMSIVKAGVDVATTSPEQLYTAQNIHQIGTWIPLQVACCLAAEESRKKADRVADAWAAKRRAAESKIMTKQAPAWLSLSADRSHWLVIEERAAHVRLMFDLAAAGLGVGRIAKRLNEQFPDGMMGKGPPSEEFPDGQPGKGWQPAAIAGVLRSRAVLGELQRFTGVCAGRAGPRRAARSAIPSRDISPPSSARPCTIACKRPLTAAAAAAAASPASQTCSTASCSTRRTASG